MQYKTANQLTNSTDQDYYLNKADLAVQSDWSQFDPTILVQARDSAPTDANGILQLPENTMELLYLEDGSNREITKIAIEDRNGASGYYFAGMKSDNTKRQLQVMQNGNPLASTTLFFIVLKLVPMAAPTSSQPVIPEEFRELIAVKAAEFWHRDQGPQFFDSADGWLSFYRDVELPRARRSYKTLDTQPTFAKTFDSDAGGFPYEVHRTT